MAFRAVSVHPGWHLWGLRNFLMLRCSESVQVSANAVFCSAHDDLKVQTQTTENKVLKGTASDDSAVPLNAQQCAFLPQF